MRPSLGGNLSRAALSTEDELFGHPGMVRTTRPQMRNCASGNPGIRRGAIAPLRFDAMHRAGMTVWIVVDVGVGDDAPNRFRCLLLLALAALACRIARVALGLLFGLQRRQAGNFFFLLADERGGFLGGAGFLACLLFGLGGVAGLLGLGAR